MALRDEILEQPAVARRLIEAGRETVERVAGVLRGRTVDQVVIAARGSSDHAAIYGQYILGVRNALPVALAAPSILSMYGVTPRFRHALVVGISQSGASPDIVGVIGAARAQGSPTIAITNVPDSPLAAAAEHVLDLRAGTERSVAATKTYTAQLIALAMLSAALAPTPGDPPVPDPGGEAHGWADLASIPDRLANALGVEPDVKRIAASHASIERCIVLGRGFEYATAREWALKLKELAYVSADPYSAADFQHGPLALIDAGFPVFAIAPGGAAAADLAQLLERIGSFGARTLVVSDQADLRRLGDDWVALPPGVPEWLTPITSAVVVQFHAYHLARARGFDPETPRHLRKVTETT